jgi:hypothetical protein
MPETIKLDEHEGGSSEMHESGPGAKEMNGHSDETLPFEEEVVARPEKAGQPRRLEASHGRPPGFPDDDDGISEFAESVMSGLKQARLESGVSDALEQERDRDAVELPVDEETFFAGWDGPGIIDEPEKITPEPAADLPGYQSLSRLTPEPAADLSGYQSLFRLTPEPAADLSGSQTLSRLTPEPAADLPVYQSLSRLTPEPAAEEPGYQTLSQIGLASAGAFFPEDDHAIDSASGKHDELADAVHSALLSVYGDAPAPSAGPAYQAAPLSSDDSPSDHSWNAFSQSSVAEASSDNLSPQDVILNYFSYDSSEKNGTAHAVNGTAPYVSEKAEALRHRSTPPTATYYQSQQQSEWTDDDFEQSSFEAPPAYPVPATSPKPRPKPANHTERESGRLLGAAAIGLVGGIAIAATLAVFVINSSGPDSRFGPGTGGRKQDSTDSGYGRIPGGGGNEATSRNTAETPSVEPANAIAANDFAATAGQPVALPISIKAERPLDQALVSITGVPDGGRLNAGVDAGGGNWLLPPRRLNGLTITLPAETPDTVPLEVQLLDSNARSPLSDKKRFSIRVNSGNETPVASQPANQGPQLNAVMVPQRPKPEQPVVSPSSFNTQTLPIASALPPRQPAEQNFKTQTVAPPQQAVIATPFQASLAPTVPPVTQSPNSWQEGTARQLSPQPEIEDLIREGNKRMREGDILEARQLYQRAISLGDPEAALAMGRSFDPIYFARIDKKNAEPDAAKAFDWYRKAMDGGAAQTAKVRIENLKHFLNE